MNPLPDPFWPTIGVMSIPLAFAFVYWAAFILIAAPLLEWWDRQWHG